MLSAAEHNPNMSTYMRAKALYFPYKYEKNSISGKFKHNKKP